MQKRLFAYAVLYHPKPKKQKDGEEIALASEIVQDPKWVLAANPDQVSILAARAIPEKYLDDLDQVEILVSPFA
jgi:hypothetical protein